MDNKNILIIVGVILLVVVLVSGFYLIKMNSNSSNILVNPLNASAVVPVPVPLTNISTNVSVANTSTNVTKNISVGKLTPKEINTGGPAASTPTGVHIINNTSIVGTNVSITPTQNVTNITADKEAAKNWCIMNTPMGYARVPNSNEWTVVNMKYYGGNVYCYANKSESTTSYLFNEGYVIVYSAVVSADGRSTYALIS